MSPKHDRTSEPLHRKPARAVSGRKHRAPVAVNEKVAAPRRTLIVLCSLLALALGIPAAIAATGGLSGSDKGKSRIAAGPRNLVFNGDFEKGLIGWRTNHQRRQGLSTSYIAAAGVSAASLSRSTKGKVVVNDTTNTVLAAKVGKTYLVTAHVRSRGADVPGKLRVRELLGSQRVGKGVTRFTATRSTWTKVTLKYVAARNDSQLDLNVVSAKIKPGVSLLVDNVAMYATTTAPEPSPTDEPSASETPSPSTTPVPEPKPSATASNTPKPPVTPAPTSSPTPTTTPSPTSGTPTNPGSCVSDPMGIPDRPYLGAAVNGTSLLSDREARLGQNLALHRTYYSAKQIDAAVRQAKADVAAGRLPWISFKEPLSWSEMAAGGGDAWSTQLADALKTVPGPVWLAVHHEPEGDGDLALWTAMQARIAPIIHARTNNVAYSVIYTGWPTYGNNTSPVSSKWPGDENVDILAVDAYNDYGAVRSGKTISKVLELKTYYEKMAAWSATHGTAWAIGETGQTKSAAAGDPTWLDRSYRDMVAAGGAGLSYYDSSANSVADWTLDDSVKFGRFKALLSESERIC